MPEPVWEKSFRDPDASTFGDASSEITELFPQLPAGACVLDLGCGDGRNALPLARAGFNVIAVDFSPAGIAKLNLHAEREGVVIKTVLGDMNEFPFQGPYDLIVAHGSLHLVTRSQWAELIMKMKSHTASRGWNVITVFTDTVPAPPDLSEYCLGMFHEGALFDLYSRWERTVQRSYTFSDEHEGGIKHVHSANKLVARRPV